MNGPTGAEGVTEVVDVLVETDPEVVLVADLLPNFLGACVVGQHDVVPVGAVVLPADVYIPSSPPWGGRWARHRPHTWRAS